MFFNKKILSEKKFTERFAQGLKDILHDLEINIPKDLVIEGNLKGQKFTHLLNNSYSEYQREPDELKDILKRYLNPAASLYNEKQPVNTSSIVPIVKDERFLEELIKLNVFDNHTLKHFHSIMMELTVITLNKSLNRK